VDVAVALGVLDEDVVQADKNKTYNSRDVPMSALEMREKWNERVLAIEKFFVRAIIALLLNTLQCLLLLMLRQRRSMRSKKGYKRYLGTPQTPAGENPCTPLRNGWLAI
jgi:hypothetical protein